MKGVFGGGGKKLRGELTPRSANSGRKKSIARSLSQEMDGSPEGFWEGGGGGGGVEKRRRDLGGIWVFTLQF